MTRLSRPWATAAVGVCLGVVIGYARPGVAFQGCTEGAIQVCPLGNGCSGEQQCQLGNWTPCTCAGGQDPGEGCWSDCAETYGVTVCNSTCDQVIGCATGTCRTCGESGAWGKNVCVEKHSECMSNEECNGCDDDKDGHVDNVPGDKTPIVRACNPNHCDKAWGEQTCEDGQWGACEGCEGKGTCTVCGDTASFYCDYGTCEGPCTRPEVCNKCDDDNDGVLDNGLHCPKCDL